MTPTPLRILRMYLKIASLAAMVIQCVTMLLIAFGRATEETFMTRSFQRIALLSICAFLLVLYRAGLVAYRHGIENGDVRATTRNCGEVVLAPTCRFRHFVDVYLGFTGRIAVVGVAAESSSPMPGTYITDDARP